MFARCAAATATLLLLGTGLASADFDVSKLGLTKADVDSACAEGRLMMYSINTRGESRGVAKAFTETFPCIRLEVLAGSGATQMNRFMAEFRAGTAVADILMQSSPPFGDDLADQKMLANWTPKTAELVPAAFKREGYWYSVALSTLALAWNDEEVTDEERAWIEKAKTWEDMRNAPFAGRIGMPDVRGGGVNQLPYYYFRETYGEQFLKDLAVLKPTIFTAVNAMAERLVAGEIVVASHASSDGAMGTQYLRGAPIKWKFLEPGLTLPFFLGIASNAPHPNASKLFLAWSLSPEGQSAWVSETGLAPVSEHAKDERPYARESWYHPPQGYYKADWKKIGSELRALTDAWLTAFNAK